MQPSGINLNYITPYSSGIINVVNNILIPVLIAIAFLVFLYGVYKYFIYGADNEEERKTGRQFVLWGIIGFVVIVSVWGLVNLVRGTLGLGAANAPGFPTLGNTSGAVNQNGPQTFPASGVIGGTGATVFNPNGTQLGTVRSDGFVVDSVGSVVGRVLEGKIYDKFGQLLNGATVQAPSSSAGAGQCDASMEDDCNITGKTCAVVNGSPQCVSMGTSGSDTTNTNASGDWTTPASDTTAPSEDTVYCLDPDTGEYYPC